MDGLIGTQNLGVFILSGILLNISPGPNAFYIVGRSISRGFSAGVLSVAGIYTGMAGHVLAAAFGVSALVYASATAFSVMKAAGALYLIYLGLKMLLSRAGGPEADRFRDDRSAVFRQAFLTSLSNPKVAVFFLAFLPQFVSPQAGCPPVSILFLGGVLIGTGTIWSLFLVAVSASATNALRGRRRASVYLNRALGALLVGLGIRLAVTTR